MILLSIPIRLLPSKGREKDILWFGPWAGPESPTGPTCSEFTLCLYFGGLPCASPPAPKKTTAPH